MRTVTDVVFSRPPLPLIFPLLLLLPSHLNEDHKIANDLLIFQLPRGSRNIVVITLKQGQRGETSQVSDDGWMIKFLGSQEGREGRRKKNYCCYQCTNWLQVNQENQDGEEQEEPLEQNECHSKANNQFPSHGWMRAQQVQPMKPPTRTSTTLLLLLPPCLLPSGENNFPLEGTANPIDAAGDNLNRESVTFKGGLHLQQQ